VILNLSIWFAVHTIFGVVTDHHIFGIRLLIPDWSTVDVVSAAIACGALLAMLRFRLPMIPTLITAAAIGAIYRGL
jgi:chromate transporter